MIKYKLTKQTSVDIPLREGWEPGRKQDILITELECIFRTFDEAYALLERIRPTKETLDFPYDRWYGESWIVYEYSLSNDAIIRTFSAYDKLIDVCTISPIVYE